MLSVLVVNAHCSPRSHQLKQNRMGNASSVSCMQAQQSLMSYSKMVLQHLEVERNWNLLTDVMDNYRESCCSYMSSTSLSLKSIACMGICVKLQLIIKYPVCFGFHIVSVIFYACIQVWKQIPWRTCVISFYSLFLQWLVMCNGSFCLDICIWN